MVHRPRSRIIFVRWCCSVYILLLSVPGSMYVPSYRSMFTCICRPAHTFSLVGKATSTNMCVVCRHVGGGSCTSIMAHNKVCWCYCCIGVLSWCPGRVGPRQAFLALLPLSVLLLLESIHSQILLYWHYRLNTEDSTRSLPYSSTVVATV